MKAYNSYTFIYESSETVHKNLMWVKESKYKICSQNTFSFQTGIHVEDRPEKRTKVNETLYVDSKTLAQTEDDWVYCLFPAA